MTHFHFLENKERRYVNRIYFVETSRNKISMRIQRKLLNIFDYKSQALVTSRHGRLAYFNAKDCTYYTV